MKVEGLRMCSVCHKFLGFLTRNAPIVLHGEGPRLYSSHMEAHHGITQNSDCLYDILTPSGKLARG